MTDISKAILTQEAERLGIAHHDPKYTGAKARVGGGVTAGDGTVYDESLSAAEIKERMAAQFTGPAAPTPDQLAARARIDELKADRAWGAKWMKGDADCVRELDDLHRAAYAPQTVRSSRRVVPLGKFDPSWTDKPSPSEPTRPNEPLKRPYVWHLYTDDEKAAWLAENK